MIQHRAFLEPPKKTQSFLISWSTPQDGQAVTASFNPAGRSISNKASHAPQVWRTSVGAGAGGGVACGGCGGSAAVGRAIGEGVEIWGAGAGAGSLAAGSATPADAAGVGEVTASEGRATALVSGCSTIPDERGGSSSSNSVINEASGSAPDGTGEAVLKPDSLSKAAASEAA